MERRRYQRRISHTAILAAAEAAAETRDTTTLPVKVSKKTGPLFPGCSAAAPSPGVGDTDCVEAGVMLREGVAVSEGVPVGVTAADGVVVGVFVDADEADGVAPTDKLAVGVPVPVAVKLGGPEKDWVAVIDNVLDGVGVIDSVTEGVDVGLEVPLTEGGTGYSTVKDSTLDWPAILVTTTGSSGNPDAVNGTDGSVHWSV
jgi:hypothetical protein